MWKVQKEIFRWDKHCNMWTFGTRFKSHVSQSRQGGGNLLLDFPILGSNVTISMTIITPQLKGDTESLKSNFSELRSCKVSFQEQFPRKIANENGKS